MCPLYRANYTLSKVPEKFLKFGLQKKCLKVPKFWGGGGSDLLWKKEKKQLKLHFFKESSITVPLIFLQGSSTKKVSKNWKIYDQNQLKNQNENKHISLDPNQCPNLVPPPRLTLGKHNFVYTNQIKDKKIHPKTLVIFCNTKFAKQQRN